MRSSLRYFIHMTSDIYKSELMHWKVNINKAKTRTALAWLRLCGRTDLLKMDI